LLLVKGLRMPNCLDCNNTTRFWYAETGHKLGIYNESGVMEDVEDDYWDEPTDGMCAECESVNIEGEL
jgi:hypothetical protein